MPKSLRLTARGRVPVNITLRTGYYINLQQKQYDGFYSMEPPVERRLDFRSCAHQTMHSQQGTVHA
jgi:hypothetical protein